jgi:ATP-binding protein involved in chromosome partitioning
MGLWPQKMAQAGPKELSITWNDGHESVYPVRLLRLSCKCAHCVEEMSGKPMLDPSTVSEAVEPTVINPVGRYAIHIAWSDGHTSGIYTYEHLRGLCACPSCKAAKPG